MERKTKRKMERKTNKKNKLSEKKKFIYLVVILVLFLIITLGVNFYLNSKKPIYSKEYPVNFLVGNKIGLMVSEEKLDFGRVLPGYAVNKKINMGNNFEFPVSVNVVLSSGLEEYIFGKNEFVLEPQELRAYSLSLVIPYEAEYGNYSGTIRFDFYPVG